MYECAYSCKKALKGMDCISKLFFLSSFYTQFHVALTRTLQTTFLLCLLVPLGAANTLELALGLEVGKGAASSLWLLMPERTTYGCFFIPAVAAPSCGRKGTSCAVCSLLKEQTTIVPTIQTPARQEHLLKGLSVSSIEPLL